MASVTAAGASPSVDVLMVDLAAAVRKALPATSTAMKAWGLALLNRKFEEMLKEVIKNKPMGDTVTSLCDAAVETLNELEKGTITLLHV